MNPVQTQIMIENAINNRPGVPDGRFHLCFWEDKLQCCEKSHTIKRHEVFHLITPTQMIDGFTAGEWREIAEKVYTYLEGLNKCHKFPKPLQMPSEKS